MRDFRLVITAAEATLHEGDAVHCGVTTLTGAIGLEAYHEPFLCVLKEGSEITYTEASGAERSLRVQSGMLSFKDNTCTIAVNA